MDDGIVGLLLLVGLAVLAVPLLLVMALVKIGNAKLRIETLERDVTQLENRLARVEQTRADAGAEALAASVAAKAAAARPATVSVPMSESVPTPEPSAAAPPTSIPEVPEPAAERPITGRARFDVPDAPLPPTAPAAKPGPTAPPPMPPAPPRADALPPAAPRPQAPRPRPERETPDPVSILFGKVKAWFTEGNIPVKIGMLVLLAGVASLLKYASDQGWVSVPMELRLGGIAAAAIAGLVFAWRQRETRRSFALSLQGGAIGVLMLVTFAAFKLYGFIEAGPAFAITILLVAGLGVLAVLQNALALAVFGLLAGFLAPIWLSTGSGNHVALFSYYAVLNLGIFGIAWHRSWRLLNLLGFVFTFGIGTIWGVLDYQPAKFASTEPFLILFFALYLLIPLLHARRDDGDDATQRLVDGTLVFGTPLVAFALQAGLLQGERMPLAFSALGLAAIYAALAGLLRNRERYDGVALVYAVLAVGFATLAVPLALSAHATASVFALEGAGLVWLGLRQQQRLPQFAGLLLQLGAAAAFVAGVGGVSSGFEVVAEAVRTPIANAHCMSALLIAIAGFVTAWAYRRALPGVVVGVFTLWSLLWWCVAGFGEIFDFVPSKHRIDASFAFVLFTGWLAAEGRRRIEGMSVLGGIAAVALALGVPFALGQAAQHDHPLGEWGGATWALFAVLGFRALMCLRETGSILRGIAHAGWWWSWVTMLAMTAFHLVYRTDGTAAEMGDGWRILALGLPVLLFALVLRLRPALLAPPLAEGFDDYRGLLDVSAALVLGLLWTVSLFFPGESAPLPWLPLLNPLELWQVATLMLLAHWAWRGDRAGSSRVPAFALCAFAWITFATLRAVHQIGDIAWSPSMFGHTEVQTALTVVWSVLGVLGWIFGSRRGDRLLWAAGAVLMGVVLLKLVLIDRQHLGTLFGIVSFLAYGLLCTAVGYFAPAPPRRSASPEINA
ncbi:DUF2339 domain-containing protein [Lysobacter brunescens]|uniref:DUF2339 domain-containing protein n=1 Tax=Lysobacter brunescens TaxID=262323 RepID=A0ABW2YCS5_9GAMM